MERALRFVLLPLIVWIATSVRAQEPHAPAPAPMQSADVAAPPPAAATHPAPSVPAEATVTPNQHLADPARVSRMHAWLEYLSHAAIGSRITSGIGNAVAGAVFGTFGVASLASNRESDDEAEDPSSARLGRNIAGAALLGISAGYFYGAVHDFTRSTDERRLERWLLAGNNIDESTLAHFEGELASAAEIDSQLSLSTLGSSVGLAASGALLIALTPTVDLASDSRTVGYVLGGGLFLGGGVSLLISLLSEPTSVRAYRLYSEGKAPDAADGDANATELRVSPVIGARDAGLMLSGRF